MLNCIRPSLHTHKILGVQMHGLHPYLIQIASLKCVNQSGDLLAVSHEEAPLSQEIVVGQLPGHHKQIWPDQIPLCLYSKTPLHSIQVVYTVFQRRDLQTDQTTNLKLL